MTMYGGQSYGGSFGTTVQPAEPAMTTGGFGTLPEYETDIETQHASRVAQARQESAARIQAAQLQSAERVQQAEIGSQQSIAAARDQVTVATNEVAEREQIGMQSLIAYEKQVNDYLTGVRRAGIQAENPYLWSGMGGWGGGGGSGQPQRFAQGGRAGMKPPPGVIEGQVVGRR